jgi:hypothetical protein
MAKYGLVSFGKLLPGVAVSLRAVLFQNVGGSQGA